MNRSIYSNNDDSNNNTNPFPDSLLNYQGVRCPESVQPGTGLRTNGNGFAVDPPGFTIPKYGLKEGSIVGHRKSPSPSRIPRSIQGRSPSPNLRSSTNASRTLTSGTLHDLVNGNKYSRVVDSGPSTGRSTGSGASGSSRIPLSPGLRAQNKQTPPPPLRRQCSSLSRSNSISYSERYRASTTPKKSDVAAAINRVGRNIKLGTKHPAVEALTRACDSITSMNINPIAQDVANPPLITLEQVPPAVLKLDADIDLDRGGFKCEGKPMGLIQGSVPTLSTPQNPNQLSVELNQVVSIPPTSPQANQAPQQPPAIATPPAPNSSNVNPILAQLNQVASVPPTPGLTNGNPTKGSEEFQKNMQTVKSDLTKRKENKASKPKPKTSKEGSKRESRIDGKKSKRSKSCTERSLSAVFSAATSGSMMLPTVVGIGFILLMLFGILKD